MILAGLAPAEAARLLDRTPDELGWGGLGPAAHASCLDLGVRRPAPIPVLFSVDEPLYLSTHTPPADLAPEGYGVVQLLRYLAPGEAPDPDATRAELEAPRGTGRHRRRRHRRAALPPPDDGGPRHPCGLGRGPARPAHRDGAGAPGRVRGRRLGGRGRPVGRRHRRQRPERGRRRGAVGGQRGTMSAMAPMSAADTVAFEASVRD